MISSRNWPVTLSHKCSFSSSVEWRWQQIRVDSVMSALISYLVPGEDVKVAILFYSWTMPLQREAGHLLAVHSCSSRLLDCKELQQNEQSGSEQYTNASMLKHTSRELQLVII